MSPAAGIISATPGACFTPNFMFDWPEQIQTSPTTTSLKLRVFSPEMVSFFPFLLAAMGARLTRHSPCAFALVVLVCPEKETLTLLPGLAHPQTGTSRSRCRTIWSVKRLATVSLA